VQERRGSISSLRDLPDLIAQEALVASILGSMYHNEQIITLCNRLLEASTEEESVQLAAQLKAALHDHVETIRGHLLLSVAQETPADPS
jgi:hypothetical protein